jgi:hypothetical protein
MRYLTHLNHNGRAHQDRPGTLVGALPSRTGRDHWDDVVVLHPRVRRCGAPGAASPPAVDRLAVPRPSCAGIAAPSERDRTSRQRGCHNNQGVTHVAH